MTFDKALVIVLDLAWGNTLREKDCDTEELREQLRLQEEALRIVEGGIDMKKHYIGMAGLRGCVPAYCEVFASEEDAVESLLSIHEVDPDPPAWAITTQEDHDWVLANIELANELRETGIVDLNLQVHGNEYAEVVECNCTRPWLHSESGDVAGILDLLDYDEDEAKKALRQSSGYVAEGIQVYLDMLRGQG